MVFYIRTTYLNFVFHKFIFLANCKFNLFGLYTLLFCLCRAFVLLSLSAAHSIPYWASS